jgi:RES domain-containing protein
MVSAWRIVRATRANTAFSGEGAWRNGGRWSSVGVRIVYVSEHQSTAALEIFVHTVPTKKWPTHWRTSPPPEGTLAVGDQWVRERRSAILVVPSAISPDDRNFLLNPEHPDFKRIRIASPIDYEFDPRLLGR